MGVWEGRLVMFESLVNQQIHPLSFFLLYHSPSFSPSLPISPPSPPSLLLLNSMASVCSGGTEHAGDREEGEAKQGRRITGGIFRDSRCCWVTAALLPPPPPPNLEVASQRQTHTGVTQQETPGRGRLVLIELNQHQRCCKNQIIYSTGGL